MPRRVESKRLVNYKCDKLVGILSRRDVIRE